MNDYTPPIVESMVKTTEVEEPVKTEVAIQVTEEELTVTTNSDLSKNYALAVAKHFKYIDGELGFSTKDEKITEQKTFIDLTGRTLNYDYPAFEECALCLINAIKKSPELLNGTMLRHMTGIENTNYPKQAIENYRLYFSYLTRLAKGWNQRSKVAKLGDVSTLTKNFTDIGKSNLDIFMRRLVNYKL